MRSKCLTVFFSILLVVILIASFLFLFVPTKESVSVPKNSAVTKLARRGKSMESDDSLAVALFDYSNNNFSIQKGDLLSIAEEKPNAKLWKVRSLDGKNGSVPHALVSRIPSMTDNIVNPVVALSDFDATKNFLSFKSGDLLNIIQKTTEDTWLARSSTTNNIGYIPSFMVADTHEVGDMYLERLSTLWTTWCPALSSMSPRLWLPLPSPMLASPTMDSSPTPDSLLLPPLLRLLLRNRASSRIAE